MFRYTYVIINLFKDFLKGSLNKLKLIKFTKNYDKIE